MSESKPRSGADYILLFWTLWATFVVISLTEKLTWAYVKGVLLREAIEPAFIVILLYWIHKSSRGKK